MSRRDEAAEAAKGTSVSPGPYPTLPEMLRDEYGREHPIEEEVPRVEDTAPKEAK